MAETVLKGKSSLIPENPWSLLLNAFFYLVFGFVLVAWPDATLKVLYIAFGIFAICYGLFELVGVFTSREDGKEKKKDHKEKQEQEEKKGRPDWLMVPIALVALIAGVMALAWPSATSTVILVILGIWAIGTGVIEFAAGLRLPKGFNGKILIFVTALVSIGFGIYFIVGPEKKGATEVAGTVVILVGVFGLIKGVLTGVYAYMLSRLYKGLKEA
jgi:uncharacterized membrane protein HdeD (DUF308 family)